MPFLYKHRPQILLKAAVTVTEVFSSGTGAGAAVAGRSDPGCGCSQGGHSGSGGLLGKCDWEDRGALERKGTL